MGFFYIDFTTRPEAVVEAFFSCRKNFYLCDIVDGVVLRTLQNGIRLVPAASSLLRVWLDKKHFQQPLYYVGPDQLPDRA